MTRLRVIGIDPGPKPGLVCIDFGISTSWWPAVQPRAVQCDPQSALDVFAMWLGEPGERTVLVGCESFVRSSRAGRLKHAAAASKTEQMIEAFHTMFGAWISINNTMRWTTNNAARVKAWAKHERLDAAGLLEVTNGMTHARDGARHAMFVAVHYGGAPDPLSRRARSTT